MKKFLLPILALLFSFTTAQAGDLLLPGVQTVSPKDIVAKIETSTEPFILFVYTSWCPYCKKQIAQMRSALTQVPPVRLPPIYGVSIDSNPDAYAAFHKKTGSIPWEDRLYVGQTSLEEVLDSYGSGFSGPIPYVAVFHNKIIKKEFNGLTSVESLGF